MVILNNRNMYTLTDTKEYEKYELINKETVTQSDKFTERM
jgi:translation elongation factor P/translation initiation factor 5A